MQNENVPLEKVKQFFNENAYAIFSLTMHPTNPTSMEYTINGGIEFDKYLDDLDSEYTAYNEQDYPSVHNLGICLSPITINFNNSDDLLFTNNDLFGKGA